MITSCIRQNIKKINIDELSNLEQQSGVISNLNQSIFNKYDDDIYRSSINYGVDVFLIKSIIQVESNYDPNVVSKSHAIGLMQLKADTAGKDAYRLKGWTGKPSMSDLKNASINIDLGTAYLSILQKQLAGIINEETRRYALIVAYVNGLGALLRIFSNDSAYAIKAINNLNPQQFWHYIQYNHPSKQASRYLSKVNAIYISNKQS